MPTNVRILLPLMVAMTSPGATRTPDGSMIVILLPLPFAIDDGEGKSQLAGGQDNREWQRMRRSAREGGKRTCREGGIPRIWTPSMELHSRARKGIPLPTTATSAIASTATAGAAHCRDRRRGGGRLTVICSTPKAMQCRRSVLPPLSSPPHNSSHRGISTKSPNLQPKKIFALWKGFPPI